MPFNHLILCHPLLLLPSIFPSIRVFSNESGLHIRWPKYWHFSFSISPSNEYSGLISFQFSSVAQTCPTIAIPWTTCSTPGFSVLHHLPEFAQIHVHGVGGATQPSHLLLPSSPSVETTIACLKFTQKIRGKN